MVYHLRRYTVTMNQCGVQRDFEDTYNRNREFCVLVHIRRLDNIEHQTYPNPESNPDRGGTTDLTHSLRFVGTERLQKTP
jgi:hypothetical protein